jgi:hypothetical protein
MAFTRFAMARYYVLRWATHFGRLSRFARTEIA